MYGKFLKYMDFQDYWNIQTISGIKKCLLPMLNIYPLFVYIIPLFHLSCLRFSRRSCTLLNSQRSFWVSLGLRTPYHMDVTCYPLVEDMWISFISSRSSCPRYYQMCGFYRFLILFLKVGLSMPISLAGNCHSYFENDLPSSI